MKKLLFLAILLISITQSKGQTPFNRAYHDIYETASSQLVPIFNDYYFTTLDNNGTRYLYRLDQNGNLKSRAQLPANPATISPATMFKTLGNKLLIIGNTFACDVLDTMFVKAIICELDTNGAVLFYKKMNRSIYPYYTAGFKTGLQQNDSTYYVFNDTVMFHFDKVGQLISSSNLGIKNISASIGLPNGNSLLSASQGNANYLFQIDPSGNIVTQTSTNRLFNKLEFYGGQKLIGLNSKLFKISPALSVIDSSSFGTTTTDFSVSNDTIYCINSSGSNQIYLRSDTLFNAISQSSTSTQRVSQVGICNKGNLVGILSNCFSSSTYSANNSFASINLIPKNGSNNFTEDAKVISVVPDSVACTYTIQTIPNSTTTLYHLQFRVKVLVMNIGTSQLNNVKINSFLFPYGTCGPDYFQQYYSGFSLSPGDSILLTTGYIYKSYGVPGIPTSSLGVNYCFYTTLPNGMNDKNISNDGICSNIAFFPLAVKENQMELDHLNLFPNPVENNFTVESKSSIKKIEVYNCIGELIKTVCPDDLRCNINCEDLKPGVYLVKTSMEKGVSVKRIIKQ